MIGSTISQYKVLRLLGSGGMGEVYEAVDEQLGRKVAIKILLPKFAEDPEIVARFFNEARSVNLIGHPGLVQVFEFGKMPSGGAFLVMEYIAGITLRDRLKEGKRLGEMDALQTALQLASALAATHAKDIVHRDLKPGNVMIVPDPTMATGERVKLLDFGIAKLGAQNAREDQPRTKTGLSMGTPVYMSPEQCRGAKTLDGKADVYSLGVMMYQLLSGQLPFDAEADGAIFGMHLYEEPPPLLQRAPHVSRPVAALVHHMLRKRAEERPSAQDVVEVLTEMAAAVLPTTARPSAKLHIVASPSLSNPWGVPDPTPSPVRRTAGQFAARHSARLRHMLLGLTERSPWSTKHAPSQSNQSDVPDSNPSTLGRSAGQFAVRHSARLRHMLLGLTERSPWLTKHTTPRQRLVGIGAGALLLFLLIISGITASVRSPAPQVVTAQQAKIHWQIKSTPTGARVIRKNDQVVLGQTPWTQEGPAENNTLELVLRLEGYKDRPLRLDRNRDLNLDETLEPAGNPPAAAAENGGRKRSKKSNAFDEVLDGLKGGTHGHRKKTKPSD